MICVKRRLSAISLQQQEAISAQPLALSLRQEATYISYVGLSVFAVWLLADC